MKRRLWNTATMFWVSPEECDIYLRESPPIQTLTQFFSCSKQLGAENWIYLGLIEVDKELRFLMRYNYPQKSSEEFRSLFMNHNVDWGLLNIYGMSVSVGRKKIFGCWDCCCARLFLTKQSLWKERDQQCHCHCQKHFTIKNIHIMSHCHDL